MEMATSSRDRVPTDGDEVGGAGTVTSRSSNPDFGDPVDLREGEVPVFWARGVTPQAAVMAGRPPRAICHAPGHMAITDARDTGLITP